MGESPLREETAKFDWVKSKASRQRWNYMSSHRTNSAGFQIWKWNEKSGES